MIKIIKKRHVEAPRPEPVVASEPKGTSAPTFTPPPTASYKAPTVCRFCEHPYVEPCHGESDTCMNAKFRREREARKA